MKKAKISLEDFIWTPGNGPVEAARQRLIHAFSKPKKAMGEAWFMSAERKIYSDALLTPVEQIDLEAANRMFDEIATGPPCFGQRDEWREWFHFLLPNFIPKAFKQPRTSFVAEWLASAMFSQHPEGLEARFYRGFHADVFATVGNILMANDIWEDGQLKWQGGLFRESTRYGERWWYLNEVSPPISAMLFFCMKYLRPNQIEPWFRSAIDIDCPLWRSQLMVWLTGAKPLLIGEITQPKDLGELEPRVQWEWSHVFSGNYTGDFSGVPQLVDARGKLVEANGEDSVKQNRGVPFIPEVNLVAFHECVKKYMPKNIRERMAYQVLDVPLLEKELGEIAAEFVALELKAKVLRGKQQ
jgi:hypothetical protein